MVRWRKKLEALRRERQILEDKIEKKNKDKARVDALLKRNRSTANNIIRYLEIPETCPYCIIKITTSIPIEADHIYPISLGGLNINENMVMVCKSCNQKKGSLTLREFAVKYGYDLEEIYSRLEIPGKKF